MPELPEVETIKRQAKISLVGQIIARIVVRADNKRVDHLWQGDAGSLLGEEFVDVSRAGKYLFLHFASGRGIVVHLKMTGRLVTDRPTVDYEKAKHTRIVIELKNGEKIYYWDTRMFGYLKLKENILLAKDKISSKLGPEVWEIDSKWLLSKLTKTKRKIKDVILDQSILAGVGNIYANDALWKAGVDPRRVGNTIKLKEANKILVSLKAVLERGLALGGASDNTFRDFLGEMGRYQEEFLVYGRTGDPCNKCGNSLKRIVVSGRGTWVCENCQS